MDIINTVLEYVISLLDWLLPAIGISEDFMTWLDKALTFVVDIINGAGYFLPLDVFVICIGAILTFQMSILAWRIIMKVIELVRG